MQAEQTVQTDGTYTGEQVRFHVFHCLFSIESLQNLLGPNGVKTRILGLFRFHRIFISIGKKTWWDTPSDIPLGLGKKKLLPRKTCPQRCLSLDLKCAIENKTPDILGRDLKQCCRKETRKLLSPPIRSECLVSTAHLRSEKQVLRQAVITKKEPRFFGGITLSFAMENTSMSSNRNSDKQKPL